MMFLILTILALALIFIGRFIGAWLFRIDEVITLLKAILKELKNEAK